MNEPLIPPPPAPPRPALVSAPLPPAGGSRLAGWRRRLARLVPGRGFWITLVVLAALAVVALAGLALYGTTPRPRPLATIARVPATATEDALDARARERLAARIRAQQPRGVYVVVDTYRNRLRVHNGEEVKREAVCSTGSGAVVRDPRNGRLWIFDTPIGERSVQRKVKNPVWSKPDWAFVEEGFLPPKSSALRYDDFSLGDYGLYLGDGYIIHGTVFQTLLGQAITHGCIRLGDKDLEYVYQTVPLGARVYLF